MSTHRSYTISPVIEVKPQSDWILVVYWYYCCVLCTHSKTSLQFFYILFSKENLLMMESAWFAACFKLYLKWLSLVEINITQLCFCACLSAILQNLDEICQVHIQVPMHCV